MLVWRGGMLLFCCCTFSACATFPHDTEQGIVEIRDVTAAVECELAAVAVDPAFSNRKLEKWKALVDLDLTLVQSAGADGKVTVTAPYGLAQVSVTPSLGVSGKDTSIAHVEFAPAIS